MHGYVGSKERWYFKPTGLLLLVYEHSWATTPVDWETSVMVVGGCSDMATCFTCRLTGLNRRAYVIVSFLYVPSHPT